MPENEVPEMLDVLLRDAKRYPQIAPEEREDYIRRARAGDTKARDTIYANYTPAVVSLAREKYNRVKDLPAVNIGLEDLVQEGMQGIHNAIMQYRADNANAAGFTTYVFRCISYCLNDSITDNGRLLRLSKVRIGQMRFVYAASEALEKQLGRAPTSEEVSRYLNGRFSSAEIDDIKDSMENAYTVSIHGTSDEEEGSLEDTLADPSDFVREVQNEEMAMDLRKAVATLSENEQLVIRYLFGLDGPTKTLTQIAQMLYARGVKGYKDAPMTKEAVRRISMRALRKLHVQMHAYADDYNS